MNITESDVPMTNYINPKLNICIVKENVITGKKSWLYAKNIVTDAGDLYYAQRSAGETPTNDFAGANGRMQVRTGTVTPDKTDDYTDFTTPVTASNKVINATYPKTDNTDDADNTGDGVDVVTWLTSWTTGDFTATAIIGGCIHIGGASPATEALLTHFDIPTFDKTASDTLKIFVNHTFTGV